MLFDHTGSPTPLLHSCWYHLSLRAYYSYGATSLRPLRGRLAPRAARAGGGGRLLPPPPLLLLLSATVPAPEGSSTGPTAGPNASLAGRELPPVEAVEAMLRARWSAGPPPPPPQDAPEPPLQAAARPPPPPPKQPPRQPAAAPKPAAKDATRTNLTGAFRGTWATERLAAELFTVVEGTVLHQVKAWKTNVSGVQYLQSALLLRDGMFSTPHDTRVSLEGLYEHKSSRIVLLSRAWGEAAAANVSAAAAADWRRTRQARHYAQRLPRFRDQWFSTSFTNSHCGFFLELDVQKLPPLAAASSSKAWGGVQDKPRTRMKMSGSAQSPECGVHMTLQEEVMDYDQYYSQVFYYSVSATVVGAGQIFLFGKAMLSRFAVLCCRLADPGGDQCATWRPPTAKPRSPGYPSTPLRCRLVWMRSSA